MGCQQRSFNSRWYVTYPFIEYSFQTDAIFCFPCRLFPSMAKSRSEEVFMVHGFRDWKKLGSKLKKHVKSEAHKNSLAFWSGYKQTKDHGTIGDIMDSARARRIQVNRKLLISICKVVLCARQSIAHRGHREDEDSKNKGNFLEILFIIASESPALKSRIDNCAGNAQRPHKMRYYKQHLMSFVSKLVRK